MDARQIAENAANKRTTAMLSGSAAAMKNDHASGGGFADLLASTQTDTTSSNTANHNANTAGKPSADTTSMQAATQSSADTKISVKIVKSGDASAKPSDTGHTTASPAVAKNSVPSAGDAKTKKTASDKTTSGQNDKDQDKVKKSADDNTAFTPVSVLTVVAAPVPAPQTTDGLVTDDATVGDAALNPGSIAADVKAILANKNFPGLLADAALTPSTPAILNNMPAAASDKALPSTDALLNAMAANTQSAAPAMPSAPITIPAATTLTSVAATTASTTPASDEASLQSFLLALKAVPDGKAAKASTGATADASNTAVIPKATAPTAKSSFMNASLTPANTDQPAAPTATGTKTARLSDTLANLSSIKPDADSDDSAESFASAVNQATGKSAAALSATTSASETAAPVTGKATVDTGTGPNTAAPQSTPVIADASSLKTTGTYAAASQFTAARSATPMAFSPAVEQVIVQLSRNVRAGNDQMSLQLNPAELGKINVKLNITNDGKVQGVVTADNQATLNLMIKDHASLEHALRDIGFQADSGSLQFSLNDQTGGGSNRTANNAASSSVNGGVATTDDATLDVAVSTDTYYLTPGGVNMHV